MYSSDVYSHRAGKFVRRHRAAVTIAASFVLVLTAFSVGVAVQARRIAIERDRANVEARTSQRVVQFLTDLFQSPDPAPARGKAVTAREVRNGGRANR